MVFARLMGLRTIAPRDLHERLQREPWTVIDVNSRDSWEKGHVPGARHLDPVGYEERDLPGDKGALLAFYCSNPLCRKAPNAARRAKQLGYSNVHVMSAGISGWLAANLPTEPGR